MHHRHLEVPVEKLVELEVVVVLTEGVVEGLGDPQPPEHEQEPEGHEDRVVEVHLVVYNV